MGGDKRTDILFHRLSLPDVTRKIKLRHRGIRVERCTSSTPITITTVLVKVS